MEFAEFWLPIVGGGILLAWAFAAWYGEGGHKVLATWLGWGGCVCLLTVLAFQIQRQIAEKHTGPSETQIASERAWVLVESIRPDPLIPQVGMVFGAVVTFQNTGRTPARSVVGTSVIDPVMRGRKPNMNYGSDEKFRVGTIAPNAGNPRTTLIATRSKSTGKPSPLSAELLAQIESGALEVYVHGRVDYVDVFGAPHWTTFCAKLVVPFNGHFGSCPNHNETDDYKRSK